MECGAAHAQSAPSTGLVLTHGPASGGRGAEDPSHHHINPGCHKEKLVHTTANTLHCRSEHELLALPPECQKCRMQSIDSRLEDMGLDNAQAS